MKRREFIWGATSVLSASQATGQIFSAGSHSHKGQSNGGAPPMGHSVSGLPKFSLGTSPTTIRRRNVLDLEGDEGAKSRLIQAYVQMMADKDGPFGFDKQAKLHQDYCDHTNPDDVHAAAGGRFLAWHRAFLFFHERILQWHLMKAQGLSESDARAVALPYWEVPGAVVKEVPSLYASRPLTAGSTVNSSSLCSADTFLQRGLAGINILDVTSNLLIWHANVHNSFKGPMLYIGISARDPIFYIWHANVDRWWSHAPAYLVGDERYPFWDPWTNQNSMVSVSLQQFANITDLGYTYDESSVDRARVAELREAAARPGPVIRIARLPYPRSRTLDFDLTVDAGSGPQKLTRLDMNCFMEHSHLPDIGITLAIDQTLAARFMAKQFPRLFVHARDTGSKIQVPHREIRFYPL